jgi:thiosulfate/3-mercaptopyruvate sulfurtransferase
MNREAEEIARTWANRLGFDLVRHFGAVVDARPADRFAGKAPEPRPGLRSGHMPRSFNVPYARPELPVERG